MKIIFLDHFGVMCLANKHGLEHNKESLPKVSEMRIHGDFDAFDYESIKILNSILIDSEVEIVISSDWKKWTNLTTMGEFYILQKIIKKPIDFTPIFNDIPKHFYYEFKNVLSLQDKRAIEILYWLDQHKEITNWVCVDDLYLSLLDNFVWVSRTDEGIGQNGVKDKINSFLK